MFSLPLVRHGFATALDFAFRSFCRLFQFAPTATQTEILVGETVRLASPAGTRSRVQCFNRNEERSHLGRSRRHCRSIAALPQSCRISSGMDLTKELTQEDRSFDWTGFVRLQLEFLQGVACYEMKLPRGEETIREWMEELKGPLLRLDSLFACTAQSWGSRESEILGSMTKEVLEQICRRCFDVVSLLT